MTAHGLLTDLRHVVRRLAASPSFSLVAVLSLGFGIGANTAVVSVARAALFDTLPIDRPDELSFVFWGPTRAGLSGMYSDGGLDPATGKQVSSNMSFPAYEALKQLQRPGVSLGAFTFIPRTNVVVAGRSPEGATGILADGTFFDVVRPPMAIGRGLTPSDDRPGAPLAAVISYDFWQRVFAGAVAVLDEPLTINGVPGRIVGVTARGFHGMSPGGFRPVTDITLPLALQPLLVPGWTPRPGALFTDPRTLWVRAVVRLPDGGGATFEQMSAASLRAQLVAAGITDGAGAASTYTWLRPAGRGVNLDTASMRRSIVILAVVSAAMLVVACLNLAGLLLARGLARQRELSVRAALGASRWQLMQLALLESSLLAGAGGALGIGLTFVTRDLLRRMLTDGIGPVVGELAIDRRVLAVTVGFSVAAAVAAGLVPAFRLSSRRMHAALSARPGGTTVPRQRLGRALLAVQIAISLPLLTGAGLLLQTLHKLTRVDLGFRPESLVTFRVEVPIQPDGTVAIPVYDRILGAVREVPGVRTASMVENPLISGVQSSRTIVADGVKHAVSTNASGPDVFEALGARLVEGRDLETRDATGPESVVLNETAARRLFQGRALGRELTIAASGDHPQRVARVVGIVADMHYTSVRATPPPTLFDYYARHARESLPGLTFIVRSDHGAAARASAARRRGAGVPCHRGHGISKPDRTDRANARARTRIRAPADPGGSLRAAARRHRPARHHGLLGGAAHQRDWRPPRTRRVKAARAMAGAAAGCRDRACRSCDWRAGSARGRPPAARAPFRPGADGHADARYGRSDAAFDQPAGGMDPRTPRRGPRPADRHPPRLIANGRTQPKPTC
jgi:macrolide transport system ATP-binding/permease protein